MNKHQQEFIGKDISVLKSSKKDMEGITGKIIYETKNTFTVKTKSKEITIMKNEKTFRIGNDEIDGNVISRRPEDRIKIKEN